MLTSRLLAPICVLVLSGCASAPLSYIEGVPQTRSDSTLYPVRVISVDGNIQFGNKPVQVSPGPRWMVFEAATGQGNRTVQKSFVLKVEPCSRYFFAAKKSSSLASDWSLIVDKKEEVAGCNVEEELKKAGMAPGAASVAPAASGAR
jgi:hypothetical protein